jgi:hypothetical protein
MAVSTIIVLLVCALLWVFVPEWCLARSKNLWIRRIAWYILYLNNGLAHAFIHEGHFEDDEYERAQFVDRYGERP